MKEQTRERPEILAAAERQMHAWALHEELGDRAFRHDAQSRLAPQAVKYVAISREAGAGGGEIGRCVGERLGWQVFDQNLVDDVANRFHLPRMMLDLVDETCSNWVYDVLGTWMDHRLIPHEKYVALLSRVVLAAASCGEAVFVGRGAQFLLPQNEVLAIRVVASPSFRIRRIMEQRGLSETNARRLMEELDKGRREFVEQFFHRDVTDPHHYNLVINVDRSDIDGAVQAILAAMGK